MQDREDTVPARVSSWYQQATMLTYHILLVKVSHVAKPKVKRTRIYPSRSVGKKHEYCLNYWEWGGCGVRGSLHHIL